MTFLYVPCLLDSGPSFFVLLAAWRWVIKHCMEAPCRVKCIRAGELSPKNSLSGRESVPPWGRSYQWLLSACRLIMSDNTDMFSPKSDKTTLLSVRRGASRSPARRAERRDRTPPRGARDADRYTSPSLYIYLSPFVTLWIRFCAGIDFCKRRAERRDRNPPRAPRGGPARRRSVTPQS